MSEAEYRGWVFVHVLWHEATGDLFNPSENNCELKHCLCKVGRDYREALSQLEGKSQ